MSIYTKKGDKGETSLLGGERVGKDSWKVSCYGTLDEANASLGVAYSLVKNKTLKQHIRSIQRKLFVVAAELASDEDGKELLENKVNTDDIDELEAIIDTYEKELGPVHEFIIPGESHASATLHQSRSIIRRAERNIVKLEKIENVRPELKKYVNRLSDTIFMLARAEASTNLVNEIRNKVLKKLAQPQRNQLIGITLEFAQKLSDAAQSHAVKINVPITFSVVDQHGNLILVHRMENSLLGSIDISQNKAFSAVALKMPTHEIEKQAQPGKSLYGIGQTNENRIVTIGGGYPVIHQGEVLGGIGVSGGSAEEDMLIAEEVIEVINYKWNE